MYAVSDEGFYANTHMVRGHKAKVAELDPLWEDIGGTLHKIHDSSKFHWKNIENRLKKSNHKNVVNIGRGMNYLMDMKNKFGGI